MRPRWKALLRTLALGTVLSPYAAWAAELFEDAPLPPAKEVLVSDLLSAPAPKLPPRRTMRDQFVQGIALVAQPAPVTQPEEQVQADTTSGPAEQTADAGSFRSVDLSSLPAPRQAAAGGDAASDVVSGSEAEVRNTTDTNDLLGNSLSTTGIYLHSRNPITNDPRIRGYHFTEIRGHINGALWEPIRPDFDSPLSKLDSSIIKDIVVVKGPYSVRQGPGFAFIDIELLDTPRYECGGWGGRTAFTWDTNGDQFNARQTFWGGSDVAGWRVGYGDRGGVDYERGDGVLVASGYHSKDWDFAYGYDIDPDSVFSFNYQRVDQTDVELPAQYFDIDFLEADGLSARLTRENQYYYDYLRVDGWWNRTFFKGNEFGLTTKPGIAALGLFGLANNGNIGEVRCTGTRVATTWGDPEWRHVTLGADYSFTDQEYTETNGILAGPFGGGYFGAFGLPRTRIEDAGAFADASAQMTERLTLRAGGRMDAVQNQIGESLIVRPQVNISDQSFDLAAGYITAEYELDCVWTAKAGLGYAERAPSPTDLYTATFLEILQPGGALDFRGNALLNEERLTQVDVGLVCDYENLRGGVHFFTGWIQDFITYDFVGVVNTVNTDARLAGGEAYGEYDLTARWAVFGTISYVQGKDQDIDAPLWSIPPLDARAGLRYLDDREDPTFGFEFVARMVDDQDRFADYLFEQATPGFVIYDLRGFYQLNRAIRLVAGVQNIGDRLYQEHLDSRTDLSYGVPGGVFRPGFNAYVGAISTY
jgi:iron complex outermembrane receptor protein